MPLLVLPAEEAVRRAEDPSARWPITPGAQAERLSPIALPTFSPSFRIDKTQPIFTIGSCFARNIEKQLFAEGYNAAIARFEPPPEPQGRGDADAILHRYIVHSIVNELSWAFGETPFPDAGFVELEPGGWFDLHLHQALSPSPLDLVRARREAICGYMRLAAEAEVFVMTLGLAEAWFDLETGHYLNAVPPKAARGLFPTRFQFHLLGYEEVLAGLEEVRALLVRHGRPELKILVTVSPVAMNTTFTGGEAMVANCYMKSAQRAAVEAFVRRHDNVDYFPSYESVTLSDRRRAWREDGAHVSDELVRVNVLRMLEAYADQADETGKAERSGRAFAEVQAAREAVSAGDDAAAAAAYRAALKAAPEEGLILMEFGRFLHGRRKFAEAAELAGRAVHLGAGPYGGWLLLAQTRFAQRRYPEADAAAEEARRVQPNHASVVNVSAEIARRLGRTDEALTLARRHLELVPDSEPSRRRVQTLEKLAEGRGLLGLMKKIAG
jgi:tetratricopeptide (TPR) repeat protein